MCCVQVHMSAHLCEDQRSVIGHLPPSLSTLAFETGPLTEPGVHQFSQTVCPVSPRIVLSPSPRPVITAQASTSSLLCWCRSELRSLCFLCHLRPDASLSKLHRCCFCLFVFLHHYRDGSTFSRTSHPLASRLVTSKFNNNEIGTCAPVCLCLCSGDCLKPQLSIMINSIRPE